MDKLALTLQQISFKKFHFKNSKFSSFRKKSTIQQLNSDDSITEKNLKESIKIKQFTDANINNKEVYFFRIEDEI